MLIQLAKQITREHRSYYSLVDYCIFYILGRYNQLSKLMIIMLTNIWSNLMKVSWIHYSVKLKEKKEEKNLKKIKLELKVILVQSNC